ncbi:aldehyde ferredoxin oxidoreductase family protein [Chloroflexota bacterium]
MALNRKIAYVDLTKGEVRTALIPVELRKQYIGGRGLDTYLLYNHLDAKVEPLSPDNVVVVGAGLLGGMLASASGWANIVYKSPITGYLGSTAMGEFFAPELRWAGFDHVVITGKSLKPSFLFIHDGKIEIKDASYIWGKTVLDTQKTLKEELEDENIQTLCIGPAGEKLVRFAGVSTRYHNAGGRTGIGAVFGSKNLKAISVRGTMGIKVESPTEAIKYDKQIVNGISSSRIGQILQTQETSFLNKTISDKINDLGIEALNIGDISDGMDSCFGCQLHCRQRYIIEEGIYAGSYIHSPGYRNLGIWEIEISPSNTNTILLANHLTHLYGLDPMETANIISWAKKLYEKGILTKQDTGGLVLESGNEEAIIEMVHHIGRREGLGDIFAEGVLRAAQKIGKGSEKHLNDVLGFFTLQSDERPTPGLALEYATATNNSEDLYWQSAIYQCELSESELENIYRQPYPYDGPLSSDIWNYEGMPWQVFWRELYHMAAEMIGMCKLHTVFLSQNMPGFEEFSIMTYLNTGLKLSAEDIWECSNRAYTLERLFNLREGYTGKDDWLPDRYFDNSSQTVPVNKTIDNKKFKAMLDEYYKIHEWDNNGVPKSETLKKLKLDKEPSHQL